MPLDLVPPPEPHRPLSPQLAKGALVGAIVATMLLAVHLELGWLALPSFVAALFYLLAPVTDDGPRRQASAAAALSAICLTVAGVHFTLYHAIPGILAGGRSAASRTAVSTLRTIYWAQNQFAAGNYIDVDGDGTGEFGFLGELSGRSTRRDGQSPVTPPILANPISRFDAGPNGGFAVLGPYVYAVFLPTVGGAAYEAALGGVGPVVPDPDLSEQSWVAYAWPTRYGVTATQAFFINHREEVLESKNAVESQRYDGAQRMPRWDAALSASSFSAPIEIGTSMDGGGWTRWKNKQPKSAE